MGTPIHERRTAERRADIQVHIPCPRCDQYHFCTNLKGVSRPSTRLSRYPAFQTDTVERCARLIDSVNGCCHFLDYTGMHQSETCRMHGGCEQCPEKQHEMICVHEDDSRGASMLFDNQVQDLIQVNISISDGHPRHEIILQPANPAEEFFQHSEGLNLASSATNHTRTSVSRPCLE